MNKYYKISSECKSASYYKRLQVSIQYIDVIRSKKVSRSYKRGPYNVGDSRRYKVRVYKSEVNSRSVQLRSCYLKKKEVIGRIDSIFVNRIKNNLRMYRNFEVI